MSAILNFLWIEISISTQQKPAPSNTLCHQVNTQQQPHKSSSWREDAFEKYTSNTVLIALGRAVIRDMIGYVAAIFMNEIRFIKVATTQLDSVDSSVGGKRMFDSVYEKSLMGTF